MRGKEGGRRWLPKLPAPIMVVWIFLPYAYAMGMRRAGGTYIPYIQMYAIMYIPDCGAEKEGTGQLGREEKLNIISWGQACQAAGRLGRP